MNKQIIAGLIVVTNLAIPTLLPLEAFARDRDWDNDRYVLFCRKPHKAKFYQVGTYRFWPQAKYEKHRHESWGEDCDIKHYD